MEVTLIQQKIFEVRGVKVMFDFHIAELYGVTTKALNQAVKRNLRMFPGDFMFRLTMAEWLDIRSQIVTGSQNKRNVGVTPYAFTEHGIAMLASILKSDRAVAMNIFIIRAFIELRKRALVYAAVAEEIEKIKTTIADHDEQFEQINLAIASFLADKTKEIAWEDRSRIGFISNMESS